MVTNYAEFVTCRCAIGFSLASFVSTQYWTTQMFTPKIVGGANAITAGWGNLGGGITQVVTVRPPSSICRIWPLARPLCSPPTKRGRLRTRRRSHRSRCSHILLNTVRASVGACA